MKKIRKKIETTKARIRGKFKRCRDLIDLMARHGSPELKRLAKKALRPMLAEAEREFRSVERADRRPHA